VGTLIKIQDPIIIDNVFSNDDFLKLSNYLKNKEKLEEEYDLVFGRYTFNDPLIDEYAKKLVPVARKIFNSNTLMPSYSLFSHYEGKQASLRFHKDDNACTYTIDMCLYQTKPWDLWVSGNPYSLKENQALAYYGNDQLHGRKTFPNPESGHVAMIFFHFVEPDHWWFTEGPEYINIIRQKLYKRSN
jgi:hypothetical protein